MNAKTFWGGYLLFVLILLGLFVYFAFFQGSSAKGVTITNEDLIKTGKPLAWTQKQKIIHSAADKQTRFVVCLAMSDKDRFCLAPQVLCLNNSLTELTNCN
jgi:hypothetical protein